MATRKSKKASVDELSDLHAALARVLKENLTGPEGELNASVLNVARQFLKDNGIQQADVPGTGINELGSAVDNLPFPDEGLDSIRSH